MVKREENHRSQRFIDERDSRAGVCGTTLLSGTHVCACAGKTTQNLTRELMQKPSGCFIHECH